MATSQAIRDTGETLRAMLLMGVGASVPTLEVELTTSDAFSGFLNPPNR